MNCPECGFAIPPGSLDINICPECGAKLPEEFTTMAQMENKNSDMSQDDSMIELDDDLVLDNHDKPRESKNRKLLLILLAVLALIIISVAIFYWVYYKPTSIPQLPNDSLSDMFSDSLGYNDFSFMADSVLDSVSDSSADTSSAQTDTVNAANNADSLVASDSAKVFNDSVRLLLQADSARAAATADSLKKAESLRARKKTTSKKPSKKIPKKPAHEKPLQLKIDSNDLPKETLAVITPLPVVKEPVVIELPLVLETIQGQTSNVTFRPGKEHLGYFALSAKKFRSVSWKDISQIVFFYDGPYTLDGESPQYRVKANISKSDRTTLYQVVIPNLEISTSQGAVYVVQDQFIRTNYINSLKKITIKHYD